MAKGNNRLRKTVKKTVAPKQEENQLQYTPGNEALVIIRLLEQLNKNVASLTAWLIEQTNKQK